MHRMHAKRALGNQARTNAFVGVQKVARGPLSCAAKAGCVWKCLRILPGSLVAQLTAHVVQLRKPRDACMDRSNTCPSATNTLLDLVLTSEEPSLLCEPPMFAKQKAQTPPTNG